MAVEKFTDLPLAVPVAADLACIVTVPGDVSSKATVTSLVPALSIDSGKLGANSVITTKITDANVTLAKIQDLSADRLLGRGNGSGAGVSQQITLDATLALTTTVLGVPDAGITLAKMANLAQSTVIGRAASAGTGVPTALTASQLATIIGIPTGVVPAQNGYRLTLTTAVPVTTADVSGAGTIYWTPYKGNWCSIYTGSVWVNYSGGELSLALTATSGSVYDLFLDYNSGAPQLVSLIWTNTTTRATNLAYQDGVLVKSGTATHRYLGTFRASGTNTCDDAGGGVTTQVGGKRYLWNYYNRVRRAMSVFDSTDTWATTNATRQADGAAGNQVDFVIGVSEDALEVEVVTEGIPAAVTAMASAIGIDSTTTPSGYRGGFATVTSRCNFTSSFRGLVGIGAHSAVWLEIANTTSGTWVGDAAATRVQSGLNASIWA